MDHAGSASQFRFEFAASYRPAAAMFGVRPSNASVTVTPAHLLARFGRWTLRTPLSNIAHVEFTGPFAYPKTAGPAHLSFYDRGLTFATTGRQGLLIEFVEPVPGIEPFGVIRHPNLTVTVEDRDGLAATLDARRTASTS